MNVVNQFLKIHKDKNARRRKKEPRVTNDYLVRPRLERRPKKLKLDDETTHPSEVPDRSQSASDGAKRSCPFPYILPIDDIFVSPLRRGVLHPPCRTPRSRRPMSISPPIFISWAPWAATSPVLQRRALRIPCQSCVDLEAFLGWHQQ